jgi:hypothetical protein
MASNELRNKTELTSVTGDEWVYVQDNLTPFTVKKVQIDTIAAYAGAGEIVGKTSSYVITDTDAAKRVEVDTTAGDITITLPLLANNTGRRIEISNVKGGTNKVIISPNATDANKLSSDALDVIWLTKVGDYAIFQASSTSGYWEIVGESITSQLRLNTYAGYGSTDNKIMRFTNSVENVGNMFSENHSTGYNSNAEGLEIMINRSGKYELSFSCGGPVGGMNLGLSLNSSQKTTAIDSISIADILKYTLTTTTGISSCTLVLYFTKGDIICFHADSGIPAVSSRCFAEVSYLGQ